MATRAVLYQIGSGSTQYRYGTDAYTSSALGLGNLIYKITGSGENNYAGPAGLAVARPFEQTTTIPSIYPWVTQWQNNRSGELDWVFLADNAAAAATRRLNAYTYNRRSSLWTWKGFTTVTFPFLGTQGTYTIRGFRMGYDLYTTGSVQVTGTAVTGSFGTLWMSEGMCTGSRIGFGSTDPSAIPTWYEISQIINDTNITLTSPVSQSIPVSSSYVIEDLRAYITMTNGTTATNGGLFVCKGLNFDQFSNIGGTVPSGTADNLRACYHLADATTVTNTATFGMGIEPKTTFLSQSIFVGDTVANPIMFKYNVRARTNMNFVAGKSTGSFQFKTGAGGAVTGTTSQANNGRLATLGHGPHSGSQAFYFTTTTRIYGTPTSGITSGSTNWLSAGSQMIEVPPGGINTFAASALMNSLEYANSIDKFVIAVNATTSPFRSYVTQYRTDSGQMDRVFGLDNRQQDITAADATTTPVPAMVGGPYSVWSEGGLAYVATIGATAILNRIYALPLSVDWEYISSTNSVLVSPAFNISDASKITGIFASEVAVVGGKTGTNLGLGTEPYILSYRTSGISDDTGLWTDVDGTGLVSVDGSSQIQIRIKFRTIGITCIPARICSIVVTYEDLGTDSHYQFSVTKSSSTSKQFAWRFSTAFGSTVPALRVRLYDAVSSGLLVDDNTTSPTGQFSGSVDGTNFVAWTNADKGNETTYLRYTPSSLADNINVRPILTLL